MRTQEMLDKMPVEHRKYLETLKENIARAKAENLDDYVKEHKNVGKGYIKALVNCGIVPSFKIVWIWFTL